MTNTPTIALSSKNKGQEGERTPPASPPGSSPPSGGKEAAGHYNELSPGDNDFSHASLNQVSQEVQHKYALKVWLQPVLCTLLAKLPLLCHALVETADGGPIKLAAYAIPSAFGRVRLLLLELILTTCTISGLGLDAIPRGTWSLMTQWFFTYRHNNFVLSMILRLLLLPLNDASRHPELLQFLWEDCHLLDQLADVFQTQTHSSLHGFVFVYVQHLQQAGTTDAFVAGVLCCRGDWPLMVTQLEQEAQSATRWQKLQQTISQ